MYSQVGSEENDGRVLFDRILRAELGSEGFIGAIGDVEGPYAFVYYQVSLLIPLPRKTDETRRRRQIIFTTDEIHSAVVRSSFIDRQHHLRHFI